MPKNVLLLYNPYAGDKTFASALDTLVNIFQAGGYTLRLLRSVSPAETEAYLAAMENGCHTVIAAGGDGTVNAAVNGLMRRVREGFDRPALGIIPAGTANDFAGHLRMPKDFAEAAEALVHGRLIKADVGRVNGRYFINVCGAGLLAHVSQRVDARLKDSLGMLAYYLKGLEQLPGFVPVPLRVTTPSQTLEDGFYLFLVLNGNGAGGFDKLAPTALIDDGLLDFVGLRAVSLLDLAKLFVSVLKGDVQDDPNIICMRDSRFKIECLATEQNPLYLETDVDGETGPDMPVVIECIPEALSLIVPEHYR